MQVSELSREQKDELRGRMFWDDEEFPKCQKIFDFPCDISDELLEQAFGDIDFTCDDFFSTAGQDEDEVMFKEKLRNILDEFERLTGCRENPFTYYGYDFEKDEWKY